MYNISKIGFRCNLNSHTNNAFTCGRFHPVFLYLMNCKDKRSNPHQVRCWAVYAHGCILFPEMTTYKRYLNGYDISMSKSS